MKELSSNKNSVYLRLLRIMFYSDLHGVRFTLGLAEFIWFISLVMPGDTFDRPTYTLMRHFMPAEEVWAAIFLFSAITQFYILATGKYHERTAVIFSGFNSILWWFVVISMYLSVSPLPAAISGECALAFAASWVYVKSGWIPNGSREQQYADNQ